MVYRKRNLKRPLRGKRFFRKKRMPLAKKAYFMAKSLQKKVEYKYFENALGAPIQVDSIGNLYALLYPSQGSTINTRTGDSIKGTLLTLRCQFSQYRPLIGNPTNETVRLVILNDKQNTVVSCADVLEYNGNSMAVFGSKIQQYKFDTKILFDKIYTVSETKPVISLKITIRVPFNVNFSPTTNVVVQNSLKLLVLGQDVATGVGSYFQFISHTTYTDS